MFLTSYIAYIVGWYSESYLCGVCETTEKYYLLKDLEKGNLDKVKDRLTRDIENNLERLNSIRHHLPYLKVLLATDGYITPFDHLTRK